MAIFFGCECMCVWERQRETETQRHRDRESDRKAILKSVLNISMKSKSRHFILLNLCFLNMEGGSMPWEMLSFFKFSLCHRLEKEILYNSLSQISWISFWYDREQNKIYKTMYFSKTVYSMWLGLIKISSLIHSAPWKQNSHPLPHLRNTGWGGSIRITDKTFE